MGEWDGQAEDEVGVRLTPTFQSRLLHGCNVFTPPQPDGDTKRRGGADGDPWDVTLRRGLKHGKEEGCPASQTGVAIVQRNMFSYGIVADVHPRTKPLWELLDPDCTKRPCQNVVVGGYANPGVTVAVPATMLGP